MDKCSYEWCTEKVVKGKNKCILHLEIPERSDPDFERIMEKKEEKVKEILKSDNINFRGVKIEGDIIFDRKSIKDKVIFDDANINGNISFNCAEIENEVSFKNANINNVFFDRSEINGHVNFEEAHINHDINLNQAWIKGHISFNRLKKVQDIKMNRSQIDWGISGLYAKIDGHIHASGCEINNGDVHFEDSTIQGSVFFDRTNINGNVFFSPINVRGYVSFKKSVIKKGLELFGLKAKDLDLGGATITENVFFKGAEIKEDINLANTNLNNIDLTRCFIGGNVRFNGAEIKGIAKFNTMNVIGELTFDGSTFKNLKSQEDACRTAKTIWENLGDRNKADNYFYHEMEAKRKQKNKYKRIAEYFFIQWPFEYGTNPYKVLLLWGFVIIGFGIVFWLLNAVNGINNAFDYLYFSLFSATGFSFVPYTLKPQFQFLASIEIVFGIFIWAAFLVIFARKYMR